MEQEKRQEQQVSKLKILMKETKEARSWNIEVRHAQFEGNESFTEVLTRNSRKVLYNHFDGKEVLKSIEVLIGESE